MQQMPPHMPVRAYCQTCLVVQEISGHVPWQTYFCPRCRAPMLCPWVAPLPPGPIPFPVHRFASVEWWLDAEDIEVFMTRGQRNDSRESELRATHHVNKAASCFPRESQERQEKLMQHRWFQEQSNRYVYMSVTFYMWVLWEGMWRMPGPSP